MDDMFELASCIAEKQDFKDYIVSHVEVFLELQILLKLDQDSGYKPLWQNCRDRLLLLIHKLPEKRTREILRLARKFEAQQVVVIVSFDDGQYKAIHDCVIEWGSEFLILALKVVYVLEKRQVVSPEQDYAGFKMFEIFMEKYPDHLKKFFELKNPALLALFLAKQEANCFKGDSLRTVTQICNSEVEKYQQAEAI